MYTTTRKSRIRKSAAIAVAKAKQKAKTGKGKAGFSMGVPGLFNLGAYWRKPRAAPYLSRYARPTSKASAVMSRNMKYGQSFNTGALSQGMDDGVVHVKHREFLGVINSSINFTTQRFEINPGLDNLMPWGSSIANNFQQYTINAMSFEFISTSATSLVSGTNTALGQVSIATQYDAISPPFRNLNDMLNSQWATSTKISSDLIHPIESEKNQTTALPLYTRSGRVPGDIRLYDLGATTFACYGAQADGNQIGQLWVSYDICFYKPITYNIDGGNAESAFITCYPNSDTLLDYISARLPLGSAYFANMDNIGVELDQTPLTSAIVLPSGQSGYYKIDLAYFGSTPIQTWNDAGTFTLTNCELATNFFNQSPYNPALPENEPYAGELGPGLTQYTFNPNISFFINVIDPSKPTRIQFNQDWALANQAAQLRGILNITICQLNIGYDKFEKPPSKSAACCDSLQAQIDALTLLVQQLQAEEDECCEELTERIERDEKEGAIAFAKLEKQIKKCCDEDHHHHDDKDDDKEKRKAELLKELEELSRESTPNLQQ